MDSRTNPKTGYTPDPKLNRKGQIRKLFDELCEEEGLRGWALRFDSRPIRRFGQCRYRKREIGITLWYALEAEWWKVEDTVRHEIAHAILGSGYGHGQRWREEAKRLGAIPRACSKASKAEPDPRYIGRCPCGNVWKRHRITYRHRGSTCGACRGEIQWTDTHEIKLQMVADSPSGTVSTPKTKTPADFTRTMIMDGRSNEEIKQLLRKHYPDYKAWKIAPSVYRRELKKKGLNPPN